MIDNSSIPIPTSQMMDGRSENLTVTLAMPIPGTDVITTSPTELVQRLGASLFRDSPWCRALEFWGAPCQIPNPQVAAVAWGIACAVSTWAQAAILKSC